MPPFLPGRPRRAPLVALRPGTTSAAATWAARGLGRNPIPLGLGRRGLAAVDPHLHADAAERGLGLAEAVVDVRPQRVQRHLALAVELGPAHLGPAEATRHLDPHALGAGLHGGLQRLAHGPPEGDAALQLLGDALGNQGGLEFRPGDLADVQLHLLAGQLLQCGAKVIGLLALAADHDAGACGVDVHLHAVPGALDLDPADASAVELAADQPTDRDVLGDVVRVAQARLGGVGEPARVEVPRNAQPKTVGMNLLAHGFSPSFRQLPAFRCRRRR